ncbi:SDR family NAD(P)-dependent oxidoreductase [Microbacterium proteolyticum]|uniref:SDR family NAD(P)-dependent oxidoreductase n=1 Tax=Microbacterium proteolyticum TaxID=1572644 RepID=UPI002417D1F4|nr:SDR family NAD(P)-dependent oxidoreductase [Microbacterium proteolyticum]
MSESIPPARDVWIIGASRGLGLEIARRYADVGRSVVGFARSEIADAAPFRHVAALDVGDDVAVDATVDRTIRERGTPALVVYLASQLYQGSILTRAEGDLVREVDITYLGFVRVARALARHKDADKPVRLVATASTLGYIGTPSLDNFSAAKAALLSFARSARHELGTRGIEIAIVSPPHMENGADLVGPQRYPMSWAAPRFAREAAGHRSEYLLGASNRSMQAMARYAPGLARSIMQGIGADALERGASTVHA